MLSAGSFGAGQFARVQLPALPLGLGWDTSTLLVNGTIRLVVEPSERPTVTAALSHSTLTISWPSSYFSYALEAQTNSPGQGLGDLWYPIPTVTNNTLNVPVESSDGSVFYRLRRQ